MSDSADFYVGLGDSAEWLGSVIQDAHPREMELRCLLGSSAEDAPTATDYTETTFRDIVGLMADVDPEDGWPWSYPDSGDTDYVYVWNNGSITVYERGYQIALHYPNGARQPAKFRRMT